MLKKSITYEDYDGEMVTEDYYFNLSKAELVELELSYPNGLSDTLRAVMRNEDRAELIKIFKDILLRAYGQRSENSKRFIKNQQLREEFEATEAYSAIFMDLLQNPDQVPEFVKGIMPAGLVDDGQLELVGTPSPEAVQAELPPEPKKLTRDEAAAMDADDLRSGLTSGRYVL